MSSRIETLTNLLEQDPNNSRLRYMLAMETINSGDLGGAAVIFDTLLEKDPDYSAAYFHGGQTLEKLGRTSDAIAIYRRGVEATSRNGDSHARSELEGALAMLGG